MRKLLAVGFALTLTPIAAFAAGNHPMAGCGLGYVLLGNKDNEKVNQILAGTTNATSGNQTFGISSGTSGCTEDGAVKMVKEAEVFAEVNLDTLRKEMASGEGEFVRAFASLLGADAAQVPQLVRFFHEEYKSLFPSSTTTSAELLQNLKDRLEQRSDLLS